MGSLSLTIFTEATKRKMETHAPTINHCDTEMCVQYVCGLESCIGVVWTRTPRTEESRWT